MRKLPTKVILIIQKISTDFEFKIICMKFEQQLSYRKIGIKVGLPMAEIKKTIRQFTNKVKKTHNSLFI